MKKRKRSLDKLRFLFSLLNIGVLDILAAVEGDKFLSGGEVVTKEGIEDLLGKSGICGSD